MPVQLKARPQRNSSDDPEEFRATLGEHLEELRTRVMRAVGLLVVGLVVGWLIEPYLYDRLNSILDGAIRSALPPGARYEEAFRNATEMFMLKLKLSMMAGLVLTFPFIVLQLWGFVEPGLKRSEKVPLRRLAPISVGLFILGGSFAWIVLPAAFKWFISFLSSFPGTSLIQEPGAMVFFALKMMMAFGIAFQLPLFVYLLGSMGLLSAESMLKYWRQGIVAVFLLSATLTPGGDPFSMFLMGVPLVILFLVSAFAVKATQGRRLRAPELDELD